MSNNGAFNLEANPASDMRGVWVYKQSVSYYSLRLNKASLLHGYYAHLSH